MIGNCGLCLVVHAPTGEVTQPDIPGPLMTAVKFDVWVSEAPVFNRSEAGTHVRVTKALTAVFGALHLFEPNSAKSPVYAIGFDKHRERIYNGQSDREGRLIVSRICHFACPQMLAEITT
jgi:hypothetical protein